MKRTEKKIETLENSGAKPKKTVASKTLKPEPPPAVAKKKTGVARAEKPVKNVKTKSSVKVSAKVSPAAPKSSKAVSAKTAEPKKAAAPKRKAAPVKETSAVKTKVVAAPKGAVSTPRSKKGAALISKPTPKKNATAQPVAGKAAEPKKVRALTKAADKKEKTIEKKTGTNLVAAVKQNARKNELKAKSLTPKSVFGAESKVKANGKRTAEPVKTAIPAAKPKSEKKAAMPGKKVELIVPAVTPKAKKNAEPVGKKLAPKPSKKAVGKVEIIVPPIAAKPVKKKIKPIGSAVVRGKNGKYDFEVFPLDADLKDGSGIYVISKRITDKSGRGHHKFVCIGQTESLLGEIKRHKKDKCIKQHSANVICLLREESATNRLKIETDLRAAHTIACNQK